MHNKSKLLPILFFTFLVLAVETYAYYGIRTLINTSKFPKVYWGIYILLSLIMVSSIAFVASQSRGELNRPDQLTNFFMGFGFTILISKLIFVIWLIIGDVSRLCMHLYDVISNRQLSGSEGETRRRVIGAIV